MRALAAIALVALTGCGGGNDEPASGAATLDRRLIEAAYDNDVGRAAADRRGADVNAKDVTQQSAYLIATSEVGDDPRLLELTLANGARVDDKDSYNGTGLIRAAERGYRRIVRRLLRRASTATTSTGSAGPRCTRRSCSATAGPTTSPRCARSSVAGWT